MKQLLSVLLFLLSGYLSIGQEYIAAHPAGIKNQLNYFIHQELMYPEEMLQSGIEGTVFFRFVIDEKGQTSQIHDIQTPHPAAFEEAMRIFNMVEWIPATFRSVPTEETKIFEIDFSIKKFKRICKQRGYITIVYPYEPVDTSGKVHLYRYLDAVPEPILSNPKMKLAEFIAANIIYPEAAIKQNVSGIVKLTFIIETHGKISNLKIENSVGAGCNEEAIRILRLIKWMPGVVDQKAVRTRTSLIINFNLDRGKDGMFNPVVKSSYGS